MNDQRKAGRPKKHLEDEHHFKVAQILEDGAIEPVEDHSVIDFIAQEPDQKKESSVIDSFPSLENKWYPIDSASRNGTPIYLSEDGSDNGILGYWKKIRAFANATKKWEETGKFYDFMTGFPLNFTPKYWRSRF